MKAVGVILLSALAVGFAEIVRYDGHKVVQVQAQDMNQLQMLGNLQDESLYDFWTYPSLIRPTDIMVSPDQFPVLIDELYAMGLNYTIIHEDVQKLIESVGQHPHSVERRQKFTGAVIGGFPSYDDAMAWMIGQHITHSFVEMFNVGKTYERRDMIGLKIGAGGGNKPAIWIDSGIHAREWLAVSTGLNIMDMLIKGYTSNNAVVKALVEKFDWYILPIANPDGYVYSHTNGGRTFRKTRVPYSGYYGADPNRNWDYYWCITGSSRIPSSDSYCGPKAFSEPCVINIASKLDSIKNNVKMYLTIHSFGQMWFIPYAWSRVAYPPDYNEHVSLARTATAAIKRQSGVTYNIGRVPDLLYEASGSSMDYVKAVLGIKYVFGMELRPNIQTQNGFIVPESEVNPTALETFEGLKALAQALPV